MVSHTQFQNLLQSYSNQKNMILSHKDREID